MVFGLNIVLGGFPGVFTGLIDWAYGSSYDLKLAMDHAIATPVPPIRAVWAVEGALLTGIVLVFLLALAAGVQDLRRGQQGGGGGRAACGDEHGDRIRLRRRHRLACPASSPFATRSAAIPNSLVREAVTVTSLAGITGSASGGMSIALAAMSKDFIEAANAVGIPMEVLHRVAAMASGGMDTLPHNGAVITLLAVTGLTHRESYKDIFAVTILKTAAVFVVIGVYEFTGLY